MSINTSGSTSVLDFRWYKAQLEGYSVSYTYSAPDSIGVTPSPITQYTALRMYGGSESGWLSDWLYPGYSYGLLILSCRWYQTILKKYVT